jgi:Putative zinc-finger
VTTERFEHFDGAYVLGALSAQDTAAYETHLTTCSACRQQVDLLAGLPSMLASVPADAFAAEDPAPPQSLLLSLQRAARAQRNRRRWYAVAAAAVAAAVLVVVTAVVTHPHHPSAAPRAVAMQAVVPTPIHVTAALSSVAWGTRIELTCNYDDSIGHYQNSVYSLDVTDSTGAAQRLGTWRATPGRVTTFTSGTSLAIGDIAQVDVSEADGEALLRLTP